jgi:methyl-accepting chemotaxis protein
MSLYGIYLTIFGIASVIFVSMLSFVQNVFIHRESVAEFFTGLPTTLAVSLGLWVIIAIIVKILIRPLTKVLAKAKTEEVSEEEKSLFISSMKKIKVATYILIFTGYLIGNGSVVVIKSIKGLVNLGATSGEYAASLILVLGLCLGYAIVQTFYCVDLWEVFCQGAVSQLRITSLQKQKHSYFTLKIGKIVAGSGFYLGWHLLCCGYGIARFADTGLGISDFLPGAFGVFIWCTVSTVPAIALILDSLRRRFRLASAVVTNIRKAGDLATRLSISSFDDFGYLSDQLNKLMDSLKETISEVKNENNSVSDNALMLASEAQENLNGIKSVMDSFENIARKSADRDGLLNDTQQKVVQLDQDAEKIYSLVSSQTAAVEQNASSITEMVANINSMTGMIKKAREVSVELSTVSEKGNHEVESTLSLIEEISEKSERMSEITQVISSVASQTNLLAMNAAIEAAHAGDAGKGFSVVADEIRKLAEDTSSSTQEITDLIEDMIDVVSKSTQSMNETSVVFNQITGGVKNSSQIVDTIANAMEEQSIGASETLQVTNEIATQISDINQLVKNQSDYNGEIRQHVDNVVNLSREVNGLIENSNNVIKEFENSMNSISSTAEKNQNSVSTVTRKLEVFKLN